MDFLCILIIAVWGYFFIKGKIEDYKFDNQPTPPGMKTDWGAMSNDLARGMSERAVKQKSLRGGYDIPKDN